MRRSKYQPDYSSYQGSELPWDENPMVASISNGLKNDKYTRQQNSCVNYPFDNNGNYREPTERDLREAVEDWEYFREHTLYLTQQEKLYEVLCRIKSQIPEEDTESLNYFSENIERLIALCRPLLFRAEGYFYAARTSMGLIEAKAELFAKVIELYYTMLENFEEWLNYMIDKDISYNEKYDAWVGELHYIINSAVSVMKGIIRADCNKSCP